MPVLSTGDGIPVSAVANSINVVCTEQGNCATRNQVNDAYLTHGVRLAVESVGMTFRSVVFESPTRKNVSGFERLHAAGTGII